MTKQDFVYLCVIGSLKANLLLKPRENVIKMRLVYSFDYIGFKVVSKFSWLYKHVEISVRAVEVTLMGRNGYLRHAVLRPVRSFILDPNQFETWSFETLNDADQIPVMMMGEERRRLRLVVLWASRVT